MTCAQEVRVGLWGHVAATRRPGSTRVPLPPPHPPAHPTPPHRKYTHTPYTPSTHLVHFVERVLQHVVAVQLVHSAVQGRYRERYGVAGGAQGGAVEQSLPGAVEQCGTAGAVQHPMVLQEAAGTHVVRSSSAASGVCGSASSMKVVPVRVWKECKSKVSACSSCGCGTGRGGGGGAGRRGVMHSGRGHGQLQSQLQVQQACQSKGSKPTNQPAQLRRGVRTWTPLLSGTGDSCAEIPHMPNLQHRIVRGGQNVPRWAMSGKDSGAGVVRQRIIVRGGRGEQRCWCGQAASGESRALCSRPPAAARKAAAQPWRQARAAPARLRQPALAHQLLASRSLSLNSMGDSCTKSCTHLMHGGSGRRGALVR